MKNLYILLVLLICFGCTKHINNENNTIPSLDLTKDYPQKEINFHDIGDVEYIPLETTDESLIKCSIKLAISDKYIVVLANMLDRVTYFFDRKGKFLSKIDKQGNGAGEYIVPHNVTIDFKNEECYVYDSKIQKIHVYSFIGKWKRELTVPKGIYWGDMYDYNPNYLIAYNRKHDFLNPEKAPEDKAPYHLINKQDGKYIPLNIKVEKKVGRTLRKGRDEMGFPNIESMTFINSFISNNHDILISDFGLDTIYSYKNNILTPIAVQYPTVHSDDVPLIIAPEIYTDQFLTFRPIRMEYIPKSINKPYWDAPYLMWNRETNEINEIIYWYDSNILDDDTNNENKKNSLPEMHGQWNETNHIHYQLSAEQLLELYEAGKLKGKLKEIAPKLKFDDNNVVAICKLK